MIDLETYTVLKVQLDSTNIIKVISSRHFVFIII